MRRYSPSLSPNQWRRAWGGGPFTLLVREGDAMGAHMSVIQLQDRRPGAPAQPIEWTFQKQVEMALYQHG